MLKKHYGTVIIGAGPAGLACALSLRRLGITDVLTAERYVFPRDKCCAGYITGKTKKKYASYGLDAEECGYSFIDDFRLFFRYREKQKIKNRFLYTGRNINRVELDDAFFRLAKASGIETAEGMCLTAHDAEAHTVTFNGNITVGYDKLVFADGTLGFGSRYQKTKSKNIAMQLIFPSELPDGIGIHFGVSRRGYGWVSTHRGITNVGLTDVYDKKVDYTALFRGFLDRLGIERDTSGLYGSFTPIGVRKPVIGDVYFVGDALGACDPFTLSGLRYGLDSGEAAAKSIAENDPRVIRRFASGLSVKFAVSRMIQRLFYLKPVAFLVFNVGCTCFSFVIRFFFDRFLNKK